MEELYFKKLWIEGYEQLCEKREAGEIVGSDADLAHMATEYARTRLGEMADQLFELYKSSREKK